MTYFTQSQLAAEWDWAEEYGLGDNYFSSVLSETLPNRLYSLAGSSPVNSDCSYCPPPYINTNQTIFFELSNAGISWGYFGAPGQDYYDSYPLNFFQGFQSYASNIGSWSEFAQDLNDHLLPAISIISSLGYANVDQHPPDNVTLGEDWLLGIVNDVMQSPYWDSSVIFINYDEGGGYFDQVPPPTLDGVQLGFRIPLLVISPYSKENYVSHTELNHASILAFIEYNWNLPALNGFVSDSKIPLDFFDFSQAPRIPVLISNSSQFPATIQIPFSGLPYARSGSTNVSLSSLPGSTLSKTSALVTASSSTASLPIFNSTIVDIVVIATVLIITIILLGFALRSRRYRQRYF
jgi:phospholipase C